MSNKRKLKRVLLVIFGTVLLVATAYIAPKLVKVHQLRQEAKALAASSTVSTFKASKTTIAYDNDENVLCTMRNTKDMYYVSFEEIPSMLVNAFIVMEDRQFYKHSGYDIKAIIRAVIVNYQNNDIAQGASTITQQLARNIFLTQEVSWERKVEEIFIAVELEEKYSKNQILEFYLNNIYFGNGYYGVEAAARGYFDKSVSELTVAEQVFIAAIPNNPTRYNPFTKYENTAARKNLILQQLNEEGCISTLDYYLAKEEEVVLNEHQPEEFNSSVATYVRNCATESLMQISGFQFRYSFETEEDYNAYEASYDTFYNMCQQKLLSGGYTIHTSIDMEAQNKLQQAVDNNLAQYSEKSSEGVYTLQGAATCIDNLTGDVAAIVGSRSQDDIEGYVLNRAYQSYRQPGSCIKPLNVYTPFLQLGNVPETLVTDTYIDGGPVNADGTYAGEITLQEAVRTSKNTVAWNIYQKLTPATGSSFLLKMGFKKIWIDKNYNAGALGGFTYGVTTEEMAGAYSTIANNGIYRRATCIKRIVDSSGKTVVDETGRSSRVYDKNACLMMTQMLKTVVKSGTGSVADVENAIVAGKTGTTNSSKDVWFCGYSKYYTTAIWVGYDYPKEMSGINYNVNSIFRDFMTGMHENLPIVDFELPINDSQQPTTAESNTTQAETTTPEETVIEEISSQAVTETTSHGAQGTQPATTNRVPQPTTQKPSIQYGDIDATTRTDPDGVIRTDSDRTAIGEW